MCMGARGDGSVALFAMQKGFHISFAFVVSIATSSSLIPLDTSTLFLADISFSLFTWVYKSSRGFSKIQKLHRRYLRLQM